MAGSGAGGQGEVQGSEDLVKDEAGEKRTERAALGEAFMLKEGGPGGVGGAVPAGVRGVVKHVKEGEEAGEGGVAAEDRAAGLTGDGVEHVDDIQEEESVGGGAAGGLEVGDVGFDGSSGEVDDGVEAMRVTSSRHFYLSFQRLFFCR